MHYDAMEKHGGESLSKALNSGQMIHVEMVIITKQQALNYYLIIERSKKWKMQLQTSTSLFSRVSIMLSCVCIFAGKNQ